jgi:hypothetical protein
MARSAELSSLSTISRPTRAGRRIEVRIQEPGVRSQNEVL